MKCVDSVRGVFFLFFFFRSILLHFFLFIHLLALLSDERERSISDIIMVCNETEMTLVIQSVKHEAEQEKKQHTHTNAQRVAEN